MMLSPGENQQMSMLPAPCETAVLAQAQQAATNHQQRRQRMGITEKDYAADLAVIGEKHFKNALFFPPPSSKGLDKPRTIHFSPPGDDVQQSVQILGNNVTAAYSSDTLNVIAVINAMWKEQGSDPEGWVASSYAEVARRLEMDVANARRNRQFVKGELDRLRRCTLIFSHFSTEAEIKRNHEITYFAEYSYEEDQRNPTNNHFRAKFHKFILNNLQTGFISSLPYRTLLRLKHDNAKPVLLKVDSVLAAHPKMEMSADSILDLLMVNKETAHYRKPSTRRKILEGIQAALDGQELSSGWKVKVKVEKMASDSDHKLVFSRGTKVAQSGNTLPAIINTDPVLVQSLVNSMESLTRENNKTHLYTLYARSYPEELIHRAVSEFKADKPAETRNRGAFFTQILSRIVMEQGYQWVN